MSNADKNERNHLKEAGWEASDTAPVVDGAEFDGCAVVDEVIAGQWNQRERQISLYVGCNVQSQRTLCFWMDGRSSEDETLAWLLALNLKRARSLRAVNAALPQPRLNPS